MEYLVSFQTHAWQFTFESLETRIGKWLEACRILNFIHHSELCAVSVINFSSFRSCTLRKSFVLASFSSQTLLQFIRFKNMNIFQVLAMSKSSVICVYIFFCLYKNFKFYCLETFNLYGFKLLHFLKHVDTECLRTSTLRLPEPELNKRNCCNFSASPLGK